MVTLPTTLIPADAQPPLPAQVSVQAGDKLEGNLFLGFVDLFGTTYSSPHIATYPTPELEFFGQCRADTVFTRGYAKHIALPLLRSFYGTKGNDHTQITKDDAIGIIRKCMEVLYYRVSTSL
jgi:20S proteasome alpha/beta subunit